jgi:hypothetical protein
MSKFLLNLLLQISKALVYSKIKFLFGNEFSFTFGPIGPASSRPNRGPLIFQPAAPPLPLGLSLSAGPARRLGPADRASVAPCPIAASHSRKRISRKLPSLHECVLPKNLPPLLGPYQPARPQPPPGLGLPAGPNRLAHHPGPPGFIARSAQAAHVIVSNLRPKQGAAARLVPLLCPSLHGQPSPLACDVLHYSTTPLLPPLIRNRYPP